MSRKSAPSSFRARGAARAGECRRLTKGPLTRVGLQGMCRGPVDLRCSLEYLPALWKSREIEGLARVSRQRALDVKVVDPSTPWEGMLDRHPDVRKAVPTGTVNHQDGLTQASSAYDTYCRGAGRSLALAHKMQ